MGRHWQNRINATLGSALLLLGLGACGAETTSTTNQPVYCAPGQTVDCIPAPGQPQLDGGQPPVVPAETLLPCEIQEILHTSCGDCHARSPAEDTAFGAPMPLATWDDLQANAPLTPSEKVYQAVLRRIVDESDPMPQPPYPRLTTEQVDELEAWVTDGAKPRAAGVSCEGDPVIPDGNSGDGNADGDADGDYNQPDGGRVVTQEGGPEDCETYFEMRAHGGTGVDDTTPWKIPADLTTNDGNQYHCFYFEPPYDVDDVGLWFEPVIDNKKILHHWLLYGIDASARESGTSSHCSAAQPGAYLLAGWAPGAQPTTMPADIGMQMPLKGSGAGLILEVHYFNKTGMEQTDTSGVKFCTAPKSARKETAAVHFTGGENICIPPGATPESWNMKGMCDMADNSPDIHVINVWPHMHVKGRKMKIDILRANGSRELLHESAFDFETQIAYPKDDVILKPGDRLETTCYYENDTGAAIPFGEKTQAEMCYGFITAWPAGALVTDPWIVQTSPINAIGQFIQPARRCLDPVGILSSCNGLLDYPGLIAN